MRKKVKQGMSVLLAAFLVTGLAACSGSDSKSGKSKEGVTISVVSCIGAENGSRQTYLEYIDKYEEETGNEVKESAGVADETWKAQVLADFEAGAEPDVLYYFKGVDANPLIEGEKVVSIDEIREEYPEYADNMKEELIGASPYDNKNYAIPVVGYWEAMFCNKTVLAEAGVEVPGENYTWEQFMEDCKKIKEAGYTPVAMSLQQTPHYWFEFLVLNQGGPKLHAELPESADDGASQRWQVALNDFKEMYEAGLLPENTLTCTDEEAFQLLFNDEAAFAIDGSWKVGTFEDMADPDNFAVAFPPAKGDRLTTDYIGGISDGYYITRKAWEDPEKREACVKFVEMLTGDDVVAEFANTSFGITALKEAVPPVEDANQLEVSVLEMNAKVTSFSPAVQDSLTGARRDNLFSNVKNVADGQMSAKEALEEMLKK